MKDANFNALLKKSKPCQSPFHTPTPTFFSDLRVVLVAKTNKHLERLVCLFLPKNDFIYFTDFAYTKKKKTYLFFLFIF